MEKILVIDSRDSDLIYQHALDEATRLRPEAINHTYQNYRIEFSRNLGAYSGFDFIFVADVVESEDELSALEYLMKSNRFAEVHVLSSNPSEEIERKVLDLGATSYQEKEHSNISNTITRYIL